MRAPSFFSGPRAAFIESFVPASIRTSAPPSSHQTSRTFADLPVMVVGTSGSKGSLKYADASLSRAESSPASSETVRVSARTAHPSFPPGVESKLNESGSMRRR